MHSTPGQVHLSAIDEERFGIRTARAHGVTLETLAPIMEFCCDNGVTLLIARCPTSELRAAQNMEREGFILMDTLLYWQRDLEGEAIPPDTERVTMRPIRVGEEEVLKVVAAKSFRGYSGHYHADDRLDDAKCDETYTSWALTSCASQDAAHEVLMIDLDGSIVGFVTMRLNSPGEGEAVLGGFVPEAQGQGLYTSLMIGAMEWCRAKEATRMVISTQVVNVAAQKTWARLGFVPTHSYYTFHKWFGSS